MQQGFSFQPLHGERDEQRELGLATPMHGWAIDLSYYHTSARNLFDHAPLAASSLFIPLTIESARLRGFEASLRSSRLFHRITLRSSYARQNAQGRGGVTCGLTEFEPPVEGWFYLDHDQRNALSAGLEADLPFHAWISANLAIGSGFLDGDGPGHLPAHTTFDLAAGKSLGDRFAIRFTALNLANHRYLLDNSNTFGGTHYNYPRQVSVSLRYRFYYN